MVQKLFTAIRQRDLEEVKRIIGDDQSLVNSVSTKGPKKDDGQSPLQVAIKTGNLAIANFLLDNGADVNYMEKESINEWKAPVLHDAIRAAIFSTRYSVYDSWSKKAKVLNSKNMADGTFELLKRLIEMGADINACDSFGNSCLDRAELDCKQILIPSYVNDPATSKIILTNEVKEDVSRIIKLLIDNGADVNKKNRYNKSFKEEMDDSGLSKCLVFELQ